jgi:hypothetical protein
MSTASKETVIPFRIRVNISAIGSVIVILANSFVRLRPCRVSYQLDFMTPGISPLRAMLRKQIRQIPNFLKNALGLPQMGHRL